MQEWFADPCIVPIYVEISPTSICNHNCVFCAYNYTKGNDILNADKIITFLNESAEMGVESIMVAGEGEPLIHKGLDKIISNSKLEYALSTNGVLATRDKLIDIIGKLAWIRFSIDAGDALTHSLIHMTSIKDWYTILDNIHNACLLRERSDSKCEIEVQFIALNENIWSLRNFIETFIDSKVDMIIIKPYSKGMYEANPLDEIYDSWLIDYIKDIITGYNDSRIKFRKHAFSACIETKPYLACYALPFWAYISANGNVYACGNHVGNDDYYCGNINKDSAKEVWLGERRQKIIQKVMTGFDINKCRKNCRMSVNNDFLFGQVELPKNYKFI